MAGTLPAAGPAAAADPQRLTVDLKTSEGPVMLGANGSLYGLSDDGVPSDAAMAPLKITSVSQKPEGGAQHPNGDALTVSKSFFRNGGGEINVMMQDIYAKWPYEDLGIDDYLPKVDKIVKEVSADPNSERFVYIPFNEPDQIWYKLDVQDQAQYEKNRDRFFKDWKTVYQRIRAIDPDARIMRPQRSGVPHTPVEGLPRLRQTGERAAPGDDLARARLRFAARLPGALRQLPRAGARGGHRPAEDQHRRVRQPPRPVRARTARAVGVHVRAQQGVRQHGLLGRHAAISAAMWCVRTSPTAAGGCSAGTRA